MNLTDTYKFDNQATNIVYGMRPQRHNILTFLCQYRIRRLTCRIYTEKLVKIHQL